LSLRPPGLMGPLGVGGIVGVVGAHVGPEGVGMGDEFGLGERFQHGVEAFEAAVEDPVAGSLRDISEVDLNGHVQIAGEGVHALHFGAVALHLILDFAEPERAAFDGFRKQVRRIRVW
jgi:hypothetical protein